MTPGHESLIHQKQQSCYWQIFVKLPNIFVSLSPISISCIKAPLLSFKCWERRKVFWYYIKLLNCSKHVQFKNLHKPRWKNSNTSFCALLIISLSEKNRRPKKRGKKTPRQVKTILKQPLEGIENDCKRFTHGCNNATPVTHPLFQIQTHWFLFYIVYWKPVLVNPTRVESCTCLVTACATIVSNL